MQELIEKCEKLMTSSDHEVLGIYGVTTLEEARWLKFAYAHVAADLRETAVSVDTALDKNNLRNGQLEMEAGNMQRRCNYLAIENDRLQDLADTSAAKLRGVAAESDRWNRKCSRLSAEMSYYGELSAAKLRRVEADRLTWQARAERLQESLNDANAQIEDLQDALDYSGGLNGHELNFDEICIDEASADETTVFSQNPPVTADALQIINQTITNLILLVNLTDGAEEEAVIHEILLATVNDLDNLKETIEEAADAPQRDESDGEAGVIEDCGYMAYLESLTGNLRQQWIHGDWETGKVVNTNCPECSSGKTAVFEGLDWVLHCEECAHIFRKADDAAPPPREAYDVPILKTEQDTLENALDLIGYTITSIGTFGGQKVREFSAVRKARQVPNE